MLEMWTDERKVLWEEFKAFVFDKNKSYSIMFYFTLVDCMYFSFICFIVTICYQKRDRVKSIQKCFKAPDDKKYLRASKMTNTHYHSSS